MELSADIKKTCPMKGGIAVFWLGQAGFLIKNSEGRTIAIDPYLTDCVERLCGFKRLSPKLISVKDMCTDVLFCTHEHPDHFDYDAVPKIMSYGKTEFIGSATSVEKCIEAGGEKSRITTIGTGDVVDFGWVRFRGMYADHGELSPQAIGVMITVDGLRIYYTGDTAYRPAMMQDAMEEEPDIILLPINGAFGNMNGEEAAMLVRDTHAKVAVPCHFWTFMEHGGDPQSFAMAMKTTAPESETRFISQGEGFIYSIQV